MMTVGTVDGDDIGEVGDEDVRGRILGRAP